MIQAVFAQALLDPEAAIPAGIVDPSGRPSPKRFSVYRNNVASSLTRALEASFPTVRKLVGDDFFAAMAVVFLRAHPPRSRILMLYGDAFPGFLAGFPPVSGLGYLPDVARLDQAMRESYHAADSAPLPEADFQRLLGEDISGMRLDFSPSLRLVRSRWPVVSIWRANAEGGPTPGPGAEDAVILRPEFDPRPHLLPAGGGGLLQGLMDGLSMGDSLDRASGGDQPAILPELLALLIAGKAIVGVTR